MSRRYSFSLLHGGSGTASEPYGFGRIYDAKRRPPPADGSHAELVLRFARSLGAVLSLRCGCATLLDFYYVSGGSVIPAAAMERFAPRRFWGMGQLTIVFFSWRQWSDSRQGGRGASPVKMALLVTGSHLGGIATMEVQNILVESPSSRSLTTCSTFPSFGFIIAPE